MKKSTRVPRRNRALSALGDKLRNDAHALSLALKHGRRTHVIDGCVNVMVQVATVLEKRGISVDELKAAYLARVEATNS